MHPVNHGLSVKSKSYMLHWLSMQTRLDEILNKITGLNNTAVLAVGPGFVREDYKALCFHNGNGITEAAIQSPKQIAQTLVPESSGRILEVSARVELLRETFKNQHLKEALPTLIEHRFRPRFFESLDRTLQKGRLFFAHQGEASVLQARLEERLGKTEKREEFFLLNRFWESLLDARNLWDEARIYEVAASRIETHLPDVFHGKTIYKLEHFPDSPKLQFFWNSISRLIPVEVIKPKEEQNDSLVPLKLKRRIAHSLEDAAHFLFDDMIEKEACEPGSIHHQAIVIQDEPAIRRTLRRVMESRGLSLNDPRDPTLVVQSEEVKLALLETEMVAKNFPSPMVLQWLNAQSETKLELGVNRKAIIEKGIIQGLDSYKVIPPVFLKLKDLSDRYPKRISLMKLHELIQETIQRYQLPIWVNQVFEKVFNEWELSFRQIVLPGEERKIRSWPIRHLTEQLLDKIKRTTPVITPLKNLGGIHLFRVDQAVNPLLDSVKTELHFFGVGNSFFEPSDEGSDWFSARDLEVLSSEFGLPSMLEAQKERMQSFLAWCGTNEKTKNFWEYLYDEGGSECASIELHLTEQKEIEIETQEDLGLHPSLKASLTSQYKVQSSEVCLPLPKSEWPISFLNAYGNCAFTAYSGYLLSLYDERETDFELKGDSYGNLVHAALEILLLKKITPALAFEEAWKSTAQLAWLKSDRLYRAIRNKTVLLLEEFLLSEAGYRERSGAELKELEHEVIWNKEGITWKGRADRIDQHAEGLILIDYKTSSSLPTGKETVEKGLGLQLAIYSLALKDKFNQEVVAAQYLQLTQQKINRNVGVLFQKWNQSKPTQPVPYGITNASSRSQSVFTEEPDVIWARVDEKITSLIIKLKQGNFSAKPADPDECTRCRYVLVCGKKRIASED